MRRGSRKADAGRGPLRLCLLLAVIAAAAAITAGGAQARAASPAPSARGQVASVSPPTCLIHSLPSFVAQGEFAHTATVADVVEVECNPFVYGTGSKVKLTASQLFSRCQERLTWYAVGPNVVATTGRGATVALDADGNATVALLAGPGCQPGVSEISAHMEEEPFETFTTSFTVLSPMNTAPGVYALPDAAVEEGGSSAVATIVEAEFAGGSEKSARIASEELFQRCRAGTHLAWIRMDGEIVTGSEVHGVELDNNGNGFVIALGEASCAEGPSLIEADLESKPFTTFTTSFNIQPPQPTEEPAFTIEKLQDIAGSAGGFTTSPLSGSIGETVDYEVVVTNTAKVAETFSGFTDAHCDPGTIAGGPGGAALAPGASATYICEHVLAAAGAYTNEASVTGTSAGGTPLTRTSNQVVIDVPGPAFTIEKLQQIAGGASGFTPAPITGMIGETVDYEIIVKNTGDVALKLSGFTDANCEAGTIAGGPGETPLAPQASTTYTCSHLLASEGSYLNEASVTGAPPGEPPITHNSNQVEAVVPGPTSFAVEKLQHITGATGGFTTSPLTALPGQTVDYLIIVKNTGKQALALSNFTDAHCQAGTIAGGPGNSPLFPGTSTTYTCSRVLASAGTYLNVATVTGVAQGGTPLTANSNQVSVKVEEAALPPLTPANGLLPEQCSSPVGVLRGASGPKRGPFTVQISSRGIRQITFYLDGRKLKTMREAQSKGGKFTLTINPGKLSHGAHRLSIKTIMTNPNCASIARAAVFVHPFTQHVVPKFTG